MEGKRDRRGRLDICVANGILLVTKLCRPGCGALIVFLSFPRAYAAGLTICRPVSRRFCESKWPPFLNSRVRSFTKIGYSNYVAALKSHVRGHSTMAVESVQGLKPIIYKAFRHD
jgi:hypothetical protein